MNLQDNLDKLPKWAQTEISVLQLRLDEAKKEIARRDENPESNTILGSPYSFKGEPIVYLRENQQITFKLPKGHLTVRIERDFLDINTNGGDFVIKPSASNTAKLLLI